MAKICFETGIDRLNWTVDTRIDDALEYIATNTGSRQGCLLALKSHYYAKSLLSWFKDGDLEQLRQHAGLVTRRSSSCTDFAQRF